ncbi:MAG: VOC family protein [Pseudomonadota bacterium]
MLGYVTIGSNDMERSLAFYDAIFAPLGGRRMMDMGRGMIYGADRPCIGITTPYDEQPATAGNGSMTALVAPSQALVRAVYDKARELGAPCEGEPGPRGDGGFYGAYFRDPDGNKLCVFTMAPA